jgi:bacterioferritin
MTHKQIDIDEVVKVLNKIMETELAGVVRYTHYALMVYGYSRIPIVSWMRDQAMESLTHANEVGELITHLGSHPSLGIGPYWKPIAMMSAIFSGNRWIMKCWLYRPTRNYWNW